MNKLDSSDSAVPSGTETRISTNYPISCSDYDEEDIALMSTTPKSMESDSLALAESAFLTVSTLSAVAAFLIGVAVLAGYLWWPRFFAMTMPFQPWVEGLAIISVAWALGAIIVAALRALKHKKG